MCDLGSFLPNSWSQSSIYNGIQSEVLETLLYRPTRGPSQETAPPPPDLQAWGGLQRAKALLQLRHDFLGVGRSPLHGQLTPQETPRPHS